MNLKHFTSDLAGLSDKDRRAADKATADRIRNKLFPEQLAFVQDKCRKKSALCSRRAGKSFASLALMCITALERPESDIRYICLTRGQAKANLWATLKKFSSDFELQLKYHETDIRATFPNGSVIQFVGGETLQECEKLRGQFFDLVVIDEAKSFMPDLLTEFIKDIIEPTLQDNYGTLAMIGTPGNILAGPFFEATSYYNPDEEKRRVRKFRPRPINEKQKFSDNGWKWNWSFHSWHTKNNTAMPHIWEQVLLEKSDAGIPDDDPSWRREWLGEWCPSESLMVYSFDQARNVYDGNLPEGHTWQYIMGVDFGYNDSTAFVVSAFSDTSPYLYQVYEEKEPELTFDQIVARVRRIQKKFPELNAIVCDPGGMGKTIIESMKERGIGCEAAVKTQKLDHIELVNSDLRAGKIKLLPDSHLAAEMILLQWKDKNYKQENKSTDNHLCDAHLYLIRYAYHNFWEPAEVKAPEDSPEWWAEFEEQELEAMMKKHAGSNEIVLDFFEDINLDGGKWN